MHFAIGDLAALVAAAVDDPLGTDVLFFGAGYARTPPPDLLFLQRKFAGTFLLCARLRARVDVAAMFGAEL